MQIEILFFSNEMFSFLGFAEKRSQHSQNAWVSFRSPLT